MNTLFFCFVILRTKIKLKSWVCDVSPVNSDLPTLWAGAKIWQVSKTLNPNLLITDGAAVHPYFLSPWEDKWHRKTDKWTFPLSTFFNGKQQKNGCFSSKKKKKKSPLPNTLLASHPSRLAAPGCTSHFSTESFWGKKIYLLAPSNNVRLFGCVWILSERSWATVQKRKTICQLLSFILKHFFHPVSYDKHFDCYSRRNK